ncbi:exodeoxyribonuclease VII large subunit [Saccharibacter sp. 17.LH.SD]|uniref:exodeoxyribonuclease VII large subunit n=1 Tax=Saccharibacter sp. 17.LH.SD TaxID=2689393 RepID=UPI00136CEF23|nr:exodeoxyribonuclease VII large subunit [Saccharibacter sp. 17.LH.SD]MXV44018.1 exodeoxyribonuclease VII large subunit [Saccharibacter sp. 17.LH.SD]
MMESEHRFSSGDSAQGVSNIPEYSVSDISGAIKRTLEGAFGRVRIRGEITELKRYASGHIYLSLKDEGGKISGVIWRGNASRLSLKPENGTEVIATGRISSYGERSSYQLIIDRMEYAGEGALLARVERLRLQLRDEGLFAAERKKALPFLPTCVGVITSRSGAVFHDICTTISRRFPRDILLWPVAVQGDGAAQQIVRAIQGMARLPQPPDVVIVARGGGSLEDLMAFNDEAVVRAAAACPLPLISAVGHETDTTLIDYASDRRAPTPTAAAELAVPLRSELLADLAHRTARLTSGLAAILQNQQLRLQHCLGRMPDLPSILDTARMRLEDRGQRLELALPSFIMRARAQLGATQYHLPAPVTLWSQRRATIGALLFGLQAGWQKTYQSRVMSLARCPIRIETIQSQIQLQKARLDGVGRHLLAVSPQAILQRGYVLVQDGNGHPVTRSDMLPQRSMVTLSFADGKRHAQLDPTFEKTSSGPKVRGKQRHVPADDKAAPTQGKLDI